MKVDKTQQKTFSVSGEHIAYFDILRTISMFGVLFMHLSSARLAKPGDIGWGLLVVFDSFFFIAVPIFFMISGALILQSDATKQPHYLLLHRLPRLLIPLAIWSIATNTIPFLADWVHGRGLDLQAYLTALVSIVAHEAAPPYWFLYYLIPIYLLSPALKAAADGLSETAWKYLGILALLVCIYKTLWTIFPSLQSLRIEIFERLFLFSGCLCYFFFGFYLHRSKYHVSNRILTAIVLVDTVFISAATWLRSTGGSLDQSFQNYNLLFTLILAVSVFLLAKQNAHRFSPRIKRIFAWLATYSFGVYLSHVPVILLLPSIGIDLSTGTGFLISLLLVPATCLLLCWGISQIRFLCWPLIGLRWKGKK